MHLSSLLTKKRERNIESNRYLKPKGANIGDY